jgi:hypothetical protein
MNAAAITLIVDESNLDGNDPKKVKALVLFSTMPYLQIWLLRCQKCEEQSI